MPTHYELMDTGTANVVGFYESVDEALDVVRAAYEQFGLAGISDLAIAEKPSEGPATLVSEGEGLLSRLQGIVVRSSMPKLTTSARRVNAKILGKKVRRLHDSWYISVAPPVAGNTRSGDLIHANE